MQLELRKIINDHFRRFPLILLISSFFNMIFLNKNILGCKKKKEVINSLWALHVKIEWSSSMAAMLRHDCSDPKSAK